MKTFLTIAMSLVFATAAVHAQYINEDFETDAIGLAPTDPALKFSAAVGNTLTIAGTGVLGTDNAARYNDTSNAVSGALEYNVGSAALGSMYISFDVLNNAPGSTGTAANPFIFSVGNWNPAASQLLNSSSKRSFAVNIFQTGASNTFRLVTETAAGGAVTYQNASYNMLALQTVQIWVNDSQTTSLFYMRPDNSLTATLETNSFVVWLNGSLVGTELDSGYLMQGNALGSGNTAGNATVGRLGFNTTTATVADFSIDNLVVGDPALIPEPSTCMLVGLAGLMLVWARRRQAR